jgi:hypothetical protein
MSSELSLEAEDAGFDCNFCSGINMIRCMTISVVNKHNEEPNFYLNIAEKLVGKDNSLLTIKF